MKHDLDIPDDEVTPEYVLKHLCIIGDVDECIRQLHALWDVTGGFGTLLMMAEWRVGIAARTANGRSTTSSQS